MKSNMTTIKTRLPLKYAEPETLELKLINILIDYLDELTAVVTQDKWNHGDVMYKLGRKHGTLPDYSPSLKERLLETLKETFRTQGYGDLSYRQIEDIINQVMP
jgi:hypothetical protein